MMHFAAKTIVIVQGEFRVSTRPDEQLQTILGSCVAACIWDPEAAVGGMNHFLLAQSQSNSANPLQERDNRYGVHAMEMLINALLRLGARRDALRGKLFGGAKISAHLRDIGSSNADFARNFLRTESIPCLAESLGGTLARRVTFHPATGRARQLLIPGTQLDETPLRTPPPRPTPPTQVELF
ncbi:chemotaxis protein CheD [Xinfangfangia sp. CPCC 101601]|uniref:Probable chemoreceptor glutamine deamidase CheD n=1 Tax=Pseudogemmobacter lacusdianii TaxID=3069608 RepID=A0ABU0VZV7_9RHOB|nr:chemotaxis protein CheD [Xinfangfangia sp. CPCC 101601]MDQ2067033.1 chemotaxis protein CheD [Xinfangfangia sp. CPCC 101601]